MRSATTTRLAAAGLVAVAVAAQAGVAAAQAPAAADPAACLDGAEAAFRAGGADVVERGDFPFLAAGDRRVVALPGTGCVGLLALGPRPDVDVDAALFTASGISLARDDDVRGWAYVEHCSAGPPLERRVVLTVAAGQGPVRWLRFEGGPSKTDLNRAVGECFAGGAGVRVPPPDLGPEPRVGGAPTPAPAGAPLAAALRARGFREDGAEEVLRLGPREERPLRRRLTPGRCHAFTVTGGDGVRDLDLYLRGPAGTTVAQDEARARDAAVELCPELPGDYTLVVRLYEGRGEARVQGWVAAGDGARVPAGLVGRARMDHGRARAALSTRGFRAEPRAWVHLRPGEGAPVPIALEAGRCYAVSAVFAEAERPPRGVRLGLRWQDRRGRVLGEDSRVNEPPVLFHCPDAATETQVTAVVFGAEGRVLLLLGVAAGPDAEDDAS